jgi:prefoldin beta subunit
MNVPNLDKFKKSYEEQLKKYQTIEKERENIIVKRQQLEAQLTENNLVKTEMDLLEPGTNIFKLVGPTLIKQDLDESKNTVNKRLEYINDEINRCEKSLDDVTKRLATSREAVDSAMKGLQALIAKGS